jgi:hypothetical protein
MTNAGAPTATKNRLLASRTKGLSSISKCLTEGSLASPTLQLEMQPKAET